MESTMIEVRDLVKTYGQTRALRGISFAVPKGQIVGFLGPNGAGKTTTMKIVTGFLRATAGTVAVQGRMVHEDSIFTRSKIGYLPENAPLYEEMMVVELLDFVAELRGVDKSIRRQRTRQMVEACGLGDVLGKDIHQLSKGYRQRVGLAQALIHDPDILILDEPTSGLDPNQIADIRKLIRDLGKEKTLMLSTHILPEVQATCDRVIIVNNGRMVADDTVEGLTTGDGSRIHMLVTPRSGEAKSAEELTSIFTAPTTVRRVAVADETNKPENGEAVAITAFAGPDDDPRRDLFEAAVAADLALLEMHQDSISLEETFRRLTATTGGHDA